MTTDSATIKQVERMLKNSQTKLIATVVTYALVEKYAATGQEVFADAEIAKLYRAAVTRLTTFLGHDVHIGGKYYDAYGSRMSRYQVLEQVGHLKYRLLPPFRADAKRLVKWIPKRIKQHIDQRLGVVPKLGDLDQRASLAEQPEKFLQLVQEQIGKTPANFEVFSFAVLKVHLEKFACRIYRDTRTAAHDAGVDLSTNFGVVYQIKKLRVLTQPDADKIFSELKLNFDKDRLQDGNVVLVIDDVSKDMKQYLINMRVQSLSKRDVLQLAANFHEPEDRQKVLRIVYEEFRREYSSRIK